MTHQRLGDQAYQVAASKNHQDVYDEQKQDSIALLVHHTEAAACDICQRCLFNQAGRPNDGDEVRTLVHDEGHRAVGGDARFRKLSFAEIDQEMDERQPDYNELGRNENAAPGRKHAAAGSAQIWNRSVLEIADNVAIFLLLHQAGRLKYEISEEMSDIEGQNSAKSHLYSFIPNSCYRTISSYRPLARIRVRMPEMVSSNCRNARDGDFATRWKRPHPALWPQRVFLVLRTTGNPLSCADSAG